MKDEIQERFADAAQYDAMIPRIFPGYDQLPLIILASLRTRLGSRARLLDVGCGTGTILLTFSAHQSDWSFVGVDPSASMLEFARAKASEVDGGDRVSFVDGTCDDIRDETPFDAATCILVEHLLADDGSKRRLLEGIARCLTPGGWLVLAGLHGDLGTTEGRRALDAWIQFVALRGLPEQVQAGVRHKASSEDSLVPEKRIRALLIETGFADVERIYHACLLGGWIARKT